MSGAIFARTLKRVATIKNTRSADLVLFISEHVQISRFPFYLNNPFFFGFSLPSEVSPFIAASKWRSASFCASFIRSGT